MKRLRVLHITAWYPSPGQPVKGIFIKEHVQALQAHADNRVLHIETFFYGEKSLRYRAQQLSENEESYTYQLAKKRWRLSELLTGWLLFRELVLKRKAAKADVLNFYIAYPAGLFIPLLRLFIRKPMLFSEQWSAYHYNFYLPPGAENLQRIRNIFHRGLPLVAVSNAIGEDIRRFSGNAELAYEIVPNVVSEAFAFHGKPAPAQPVFFMLNSWSRIKQPFVVIDAFAQLLRTHPGARLRIGGFGDLWEEIVRTVRERKLEAHIDLLGQLDKTQVCEELNGCTALVHASAYETFSVICAEAITCGAPVIASNVGGIPGFIYEGNGVLVDDLQPESWRAAMEQVIANEAKYERRKIAQEAGEKFSSAAVGKKYFEILQRIAENR